MVQFYLHKCKQTKVITNPNSAGMPVRIGAGNGPHMQVLKRLLPFPLLILPLLPVVTVVIPVTVVPAVVVALLDVEVATKIKVGKKAETSECEFLLPRPNRPSRRRQLAPKQF